MGMKTSNRPIRPLLQGVLTLLALGTVTLSTAQTTPNVPTNTGPGTEMTTPPPYPSGGATQTPSPQNSAWQRFNEATGRELQLNSEQYTRIRDLDDRYERRYRDLGTDPLSAPGYRELHEERDREIRGVLTPEQYDRWNRPATPPQGVTVPQGGPPTPP
jgi:hypothetical protein